VDTPDESTDDDDAAARGIFGYDKRYIFKDRRFPYSTVGKIEVYDKDDKFLFGCTGTMVGRYVMLTAQQCLPPKDGHLLFAPGYYKGDAPFGVARSVKFYRPKFYVNRIGDVTDNEATWDFLIVVLDQPLGDKVGFMGCHVFNPKWIGYPVWGHIGYPEKGPFDYYDGKKPAWSYGAIEGRKDGKNGPETGYFLPHFIDTWYGHVGGPFFAMFSKNKPGIVGVQSRGDQTNYPPRVPNDASGGPTMCALIQKARDEHD
jgi:hypothetical protein